MYRTLSEVLGPKLGGFWTTREWHLGSSARVKQAHLDFQLHVYSNTVTELYLQPENIRVPPTGRAARSSNVFQMEGELFAYWTV